MDAKNEKIAGLISSQRVFYIPFYQRAYVWGERMWSRFIKDMEYISAKEEDYFMGAIIQKKKDKAPDDYESDSQILIDGQQRLTTFALYYKVMELKKVLGFRPFEKTFKLNDGRSVIQHSLADKAAFQRIATLEEDVDLEGEETSNLIAAFNYIRKNIDTSKVRFPQIQAHTVFVVISLNTNENEHKIFDTINSLGTDLSTEELMKNLLFTEETYEQYREIWQPIFEADNACKMFWKTQKIGSRNLGSRSMSYWFFHTLLQIVMHDPRNNVSSEDRRYFRKYDEQNQFSYYQTIIENGKWDNIEFARLIASYARLYREICTANMENSPESTKTPLNRILLLVSALGLTTVMPYILYIVHNVEEQEYNKIFEFLETYLVRQRICNKSTSSYSDFFTERLIGLHIDSYEKLHENISSIKFHENMAMPSNNDVLRSIRDNKMQTDRGKCILYLMESKLREIGGCQTVLKPYSDYTLEHLIPQKWQTNWPIPGGLNAEERIKFEEDRNLAIGTLGNMAIITQGLNSSISNSSWETKLNKGLREKAADLETMKDVISESIWDEPSIAKRSVWLSEWANYIWENDCYSEEEDLETGRKRDNTKYSLDDSNFLAKGAFVKEIVKRYIEKYPNTTYSELKSIFSDELLDPNFRRIGLLCTESEIHDKALKNGRVPTWEEKDSWYDVKNDDAWFVSSDSIRFVVNNQWTKRSILNILKVADNEGWQYYTNKQAGCIGQNTDTERARTKRRPPFRFSMIGLKPGDKIIFSPLNLEVTIASDNEVSYHGVKQKTSVFCKEYMPNHLRNRAEAYQGPAFFTYYGKSLADLREEIENK